MSKIFDRPNEIAALIAIAFWIFVVVPIGYAANFAQLREWLTHDSAGFFACVSAAVAIVQAALFVWNLILIRQTLEPARQVAEATRESFIATHRTWVNLSPIIAEIEFTGDAIQYSVQLQSENFGNSPAYFVSAGLVFYQGLGYSVGAPERQAVVQDTIEWAELGSAGIILTPGQSTTSVFNGAARNSAQVDAIAAAQIANGVPRDNLRQTLSGVFCVIYKSQASSAWCQTSGVFLLRHKDGVNLTRELGKVSSADLRIVTLPMYSGMT